MKVTSHRKPNGEHELRDEAGAVVGRAWRWPNKSRGFGLALHGVYWRGDTFNTGRGGNTATACRTLGHARDKASTVLDTVRAQSPAQPAPARSVGGAERMTTWRSG